MGVRNHQVVHSIVPVLTEADRSFVKQVLTAAVAVQTSNRGNQWIPNLPRSIKDAAQQVAMA